ncbi:ATP-binding protein [Ideonella sp. YS5]|uniref:ATP-binding protein n=1 Tax=Ideonella sp. YS5 TaxID=3453714 RepID=UPI003EEAEBFB
MSRRVRGGSLRRKVLLAILLMTLGAVLLALGAMVAYDLRAYHKSWLADVDAQAALVARTVAPALAFDDVRVAKENLGMLRLQPKVRAAAIYTTRGAVFARYLAEGATDDFPPLPGSEGAIVEGRRLVVLRRIIEHGEILGTVYLQADYEIYDRLLNYAVIGLFVAGLTMLIAALLSRRLARLVLRPVFAVGAAAREVVERQDYSRRVEQHDDGELGALVEAFNDLMSEVQRRTAELEISNQDKAREVEERRAAQQDVIRLNEQLEQRVSERTAALERSNAELALASHAAEAANRAKSEFLSNMSHELRTPLNAIIGFGQMLSVSDLATLPPERYKAFLEHIVKAGHHLLSLINDILNLAQIEAGKMTLSIEPIRLAEVLEECHSLIQPSAERRGIRLLFPDAGLAQVSADRTRIKQVLLNLLSNAVKYNREAGSVVVDIIPMPPDKLRLSVQDTGIGMRPDQLKALFQPFNRLGQEGGPQEGTGIGLVVTRRLVQMMGGTLGVSSTPGAGSVFWVDLPAVPADDAITVPQALLAGGPDERPPQAPGKPTTVLCVEDNPASVDLIHALLSTRPEVRLLTAGDGQSGVDLARQQQPDVILMDNNMPVLSGTEAQVLLRKDPRTAHIPVIAISANAMPDAVEKGLAAGFFRYLTKPLDLTALGHALDEALELSAQRRRER